MQRFILIVLCVLSVKGFAQVATFDFSSIPNTPATTSLPPSSAVNVTASALTEGSGIVPVATSGAMNASGWNSATMDATDYFEFTLTPNASHVLTITSLAFGYRRSATGPGMYQIGYTIGGGAETLTTATILASSPTTTSTILVPLSIVTTQSVRLRLYAWGASSSAGTFRLSNMTGGSSGVTVNGSAPLPVGLVSFAGQAVQHTVALTWVTSWEAQNEGFDILKGLSPTSLEKIGFVEGRNMSEQSTYSFTDDNVEAGQVYYYKLNQRDIGGNSTSSKIITVRAGIGFSERQASIYPNPNQGRFTLSSEVAALSIRLYNCTGTEVPVTISGSSGLREVSLEGKASAGLYFLRIQQADGRYEQPLKVIIE